MAELVPKEAEVHGLVALMEIQASRTAARMGPSGERPAKEWMFVPAFILLGLVYAMQKPRQRRREAERVAA